MIATGLNAFGIAAALGRGGIEGMTEEEKLAVVPLTLREAGRIIGGAFPFCVRLTWSLLSSTKDSLEKENGEREVDVGEVGVDDDVKGNVDDSGIEESGTLGIDLDDNEFEMEVDVDWITVVDRFDGRAGLLSSRPRETAADAGRGVCVCKEEEEEENTEGEEAVAEERET